MKIVWTTVKGVTIRRIYVDGYLRRTDVVD